MTPEERIKVAEFLGWTECFIGSDGDCYGVTPIGPEVRPCTKLPNPTESADDDYLVLEAMRKHGYAMRISWGARHYQKGDYARALLKVIE